MAHIISFVNQKGGVGKTTSAVNVAAFLAKKKKETLLIDLDPQANATSGLGIKEAKAGLYEVLTQNFPPESTILQTQLNNLYLLPSTPNLAGANIELVTMENREFRLKEILDKIKRDLDYIIIDSPPSLGILTINGLVASEKVIIPVQCEYYALEGLGQLLNTINLVQENLQPNLSVLGVLLTMRDHKTRLSREVVLEVQRNFPGKVFETIIPRNVRLSEAPSFGKTILEYDRFSKGARAYKRVVREIMESV
ncbi:AAA family ATPase [Patescibacteria group bacterium]|nr:AAA family ATPase [Patescibacteria group bacterium]